MLHPKAILDAHGLTPRKSLGQNFLFDDNILSRIVNAAAITAEDVVLEVGPGLGHLTRHLVEQAGQVVAVELDGRLIPLLRESLGGYQNLLLLQADVFDDSWDAAVGRTPYKLVANVPYYITGAIMRHFLEHAHPPSRMVMTLQKEVAQRLTAEPGDMSLLAVSAQFYGQVSLVDMVKAGSFWPRPDVDSAIICIDMKDARQWPVPASQFFRVVRAGFSQKRKQLQKNLRELGLGQQQLEAAFEEANIIRQRRAQSLSVAEWVRLTSALYPPQGGKPTLPTE